LLIFFDDEAAKMEPPLFFGTTSLLELEHHGLCLTHRGATILKREPMAQTFFNL
jgi:hypothetical protein